MKKVFFLIPLLGFLSACQIYGNDRLAEYRNLCTQHGYKVGTREFQRCMDEYESRGKEKKFLMTTSQPYTSVHSIPQGWLQQGYDHA